MEASATEVPGYAWHYAYSSVVAWYDRYRADSACPGGASDVIAECEHWRIERPRDVIRESLGYATEHAIER